MLSHPDRRQEAPPADLETAYAHCRTIARRHYENFPVVSLFLPRDLRGPVAALYAYAREADDFADEPRFADRRMIRLKEWEDRLEAAVAGRAGDPIFAALADTLNRFRLSPEPFRDLLSAFREDAAGRRYDRWEEVRDYCRRSANPVGRILLALFGRDEEGLQAGSDALCTALQLTNFWQDLGVDATRGRLYLPAEDLRRHGVSAESILRGTAPGRPGFVPLMEEMAARTEALFRESRDLGRRIGGRLGFQVRLTWLGGMRVLEQTRRLRFDVFLRRPRLSTAAWGPILLRACLGSPRSET